MPRVYTVRKYRKGGRSGVPIVIPGVEVAPPKSLFQRLGESALREIWNVVSGKYMAKQPSQWEGDRRRRGGVGVRKIGARAMASKRNRMK